MMFQVTSNLFYTIECENKVVVMHVFLGNPERAGVLMCIHHQEGSSHCTRKQADLLTTLTCWVIRGRMKLPNKTLSPVPLLFSLHLFNSYWRVSPCLTFHPSLLPLLLSFPFIAFHYILQFIFFLQLCVVMIFYKLLCLSSTSWTF